MGFSRQEYWSGAPLPSPTQQQRPSKIHDVRHNSAVWGLLHFIPCPPEGSRVPPRRRVSPRASDLPQPSSQTLTGVTSVHSPPRSPRPRHRTPAPPPYSQAWAHFTPLGATLPSGLRCASPGSCGPTRPPRRKEEDPSHPALLTPPFQPSVLFWRLPMGIEHNLLTAAENPGKTLNVTVASESLRPHGCSPPGSSVHGIFQARVLEWVAMPSSRGSPPPRD